LEIAAISMVKDAAWLIAANIRHHAAAGVSRFLVVDHGSTDGTPDLLRRLAADVRLELFVYDGPFRQAEILTDLARYAFRTGSDWVIPIDADEFWVCEGALLPEALGAEEADALQVPVVNFVQRRDQRVSYERALLTMTRRVREPIGREGEAHSIVNGGQAAFVEARFLPKWITRASPSLTISRGNHHVHGPSRRRRTDSIVCLHAPLTSFEHLQSRREHGLAVAAVADDPRVGWQSRRWQALADAGELEREWAANSYDETGCIERAGEKRPLVEDLRLASAVADHLAAPETSTSSPEQLR
jgi:hypothetical protein